MTLIPAPHKITSAAVIIAAMAVCAVPGLRAQSRLPSQGGMGPAPFSPASASPVSGGVAAAANSLAPLPPDDLPEDAGYQPPPLAGSIDGTDYVAPTGTFRIHIPVYPDLGGQINDSANVVTFQDAYGDHSSIGFFPLDASLRVEEFKRGRKDFLLWFFQTYIQADFLRNMPGTTAMPNERFDPNTQGGALFIQLLIPDGSVYAERVFLFPPNPPPVAKRGNLVFERDGLVYVLSTELTERIFQHDTWKKTDAEEEAILRDRVYDLLSRMVFKKTAPPAAPPSAPVPPPRAPASTGTTPALPVITYPDPSPTGTNANAPKK